MAAAAGTPYLFLGTRDVGVRGGVVFKSSSEELAALLKHIRTLPIPIHGVDTAASYGQPNLGASERNLGAAGIGGTDLVLDTKVLVGEEHALSKEKIRASIDQSLANLKVSKVRVLYAHSPDASTPIANTVAAFGEVLKEGKAESVSNPVFAKDEG